MNNREAGSRYETQAEQFLKAQGFHILARNYRCRRAEIDLIAAEGRYLVFVEVKQRSTARCGYGLESVDSAKQRRICLAAGHYLYRNRIPEDTPVRFDVVSIDEGRMTLVRNAFLWSL